MEQDPNLIKYEELTKRISKVLLYFFLALVGLATLIVFIAYMSKEIMFSDLVNSGTTDDQSLMGIRFLTYNELNISMMCVSSIIFAVSLFS